ncbi:hypothetical protein [Rhodococcus sp. NPDC127527]|uniref:hypothetical protein n=1 Tax=Rhodococcus sp. NPDC127527 TaxID=3345394 RepID=UPI00362F3366
MSSPRLAEIRRRHKAAQRLEPIESTCGHWHQDPLRCPGVRAVSHRTGPRLQGKPGLDVDVVRRTARVLMERTGFPGLYPIELVRELWMRGGEDRELAEKIHAAGGARL